MIFAIYRRESDLCITCIRTLLGYYEAGNIEDVKKEFPHGFLTGYDVVEVKPESAETIREKFEKLARR